MKNLQIWLVRGGEVLQVKINRYDTEHARGEGFVLEVSTPQGRREIVGCVISSTLVAIEGKNLLGKSAKLTDYEKVVLACRAYNSPDFPLSENNEFLIVTDNYEKLVDRTASPSKIKEEIKATLFSYFNFRPTDPVNGLSLYCSLPYDITSIRQSLLLLQEIGDVLVTSTTIDHWHNMYRLNPEIYKELEGKLEQSERVARDERPLIAQEEGEYDFFICHANEDKETYVRGLATKLIEVGLKVWYDEFSLKWGDSLRQRIERGLRESKHGIVVLSPYFFAKKWPQRELDGLLELEGPHKKILPIWFKIDKDGVAKYSPILAGRVALMAKDGYDKVIGEAKRLLRETP